MKDKNPKSFLFDRSGTVGYIAPEILIKENKVWTHRIDIFSVGVTMIEMFLRKNPFNGATYKDSIRENFSAKVDWISMKILGISDECIEFMKGMVTSDPYARSSDDKCLRHGVFTRIDPTYDAEPLNYTEIMKHLNPPNS